MTPLIFPKKGFDPAKMLQRMHYPLRIFSHHDHHRTQQVYKRLVRTLLRNLKQWKEFVAIRSRIEDVFKVAKEAFPLWKLHRHSRLSVVKVVAVNVLLLETKIAMRVDEKKKLQRVAEW